MGALASAAARRGLSPPTRGIPYPVDRQADDRRSIPAYAGDPSGAPAKAQSGGVYPRLRGGSPSAATIDGQRDGLSPPTRGIPPAMPNPNVPPRSIPAYAGDPWRGCAAGGKRGVYPRLRGGSGHGLYAVRYGLGLSPPTRGIPPKIVLDGIANRSIPAYAGDPRPPKRSAPL